MGAGTYYCAYVVDETGEATELYIVRPYEASKDGQETNIETEYGTMPKSEYIYVEKKTYDDQGGVLLEYSIIS